MSEPAQIVYTFDGFLFTHGRRIGERWTLCGANPFGTSEFEDEGPRAGGLMCPSCAAHVADPSRSEGLNDDDLLAHQHAVFHDSPDTLLYRLCPWELCDFWEIGVFLRTSANRPAIRADDEIREAHGRFHYLPGALLDDDEDDFELCEFYPVAQMLVGRCDTGESAENLHERFHDRPAIFAGQPECSDPGCPFGEVAAFVATQWARPPLSCADRLQDAHGRFHDLPGALLADDCPLDRCTFWAVASTIASDSR